MIDVERMARLYSERFPDRPAMSASKGWLTGTWAIGACYKNPNPLYGSYPRGYLDRVHCMFPDARQVLHVFSGGLTLSAAVAVYSAALTRDSKTLNVSPESIELVDSKGPDEGRHPTWQGDVCAMPAEWAGRFDLILADPPYSPADAEKYGVKMPNVRAVMAELRRVAQPGATLVYLDQKWPLHSKRMWSTFGHVGLVRSTMHRMRLVSFFEAV